MDRRALLKLGLVGAGSVAAPVVVSAKNTDSSAMAGGLYYTRENPGRWGKKVDGHFPIVENLNNGKIKVTTGHEMNGFKHYIVKHIALDQNYRFLTEYLFDPLKDKAAISTLDLGNYKGMVHVLSVCNKHDTWMNTTTV